MNTEYVTLEQTDSQNAKPVKFELQHAIAVLSLSNSCWKVKDTNFEWNGKELKKKSKK